MEQPKKRVRVKVTQIVLDGVTTDAKPCTSCGEIKPLEEFPTVAHGLGGRGSQCKVCKKDRTADTKKVYREGHKDQYREYARRSRERNRDQIRERNRERYQRDPEIARARCRAYYHKNKDAIKIARQQNKPESRVYMRGYMQKRRAEQKETT